MKTKSFLRNTLAAVLLLSATQCTSDLAKLNIDPTSASADNFNPNFLMTTSQVEYTGSADYSYETWRAQLIHCSVMMQHFSHVATYWVGDKYLLNQTYAEAYFTDSYAGGGANLGQVNNIVALTELIKDKPEYSNLYQMARIWKVVIFHRITDLYGDVPYSEAGQGYYKGILKPKYDSQSDIYADMLKELDEAAAALDPSKDVPTGDLLYSGDAGKWKKLAYSMMLRLGTRLSKVDPNASKTWVEKAAAGGTFASIADNAYIVADPSNGQPTINRISQVLNLPYEINVIRWSKTFIDFLKNNNDPRLPALAELAPAGADHNTPGVAGDNTYAIQQGMPNGHDLLGAAQDVSKEPDYPGVVNGDPLGGYSRPRNTVLAKNGGPTFVITYAETELLLAEAAQLGYNVTGSAATHYNNGVTAAMSQLAQFDAAATVAPADIATYLTANPYVPANGLVMINTQYWAATVLNDYETFANWRRTGIPALVPVNYPNNVTGGTIPRRLIYPQNEAAVNTDNYNSAVAKINGGNTLVGRVWWDN
ncbi:MAG: SusD/RagB family nutrient-binding outer membrane lipoprotein [Bacteroidetes bacterium]|nr:SusD/RagB family nutrient-binding outer membrane lipoprotein [Bacteroidota bacterium]